ncbi:hypothetical protein FJW04_02765 [Mesorhizobium sp. B2-7-3]|nr:hypothetical protein FJW04_02765 [Mesorhizobium sp. B2-7-3]TPL77726.1 hypothetical protein FJ954_03465 [Mesorhizobium sp. B2-3-15]
MDRLRQSAQGRGAERRADRRAPGRARPYPAEEEGGIIPLTGRTAAAAAGPPRGRRTTGGPLSRARPPAVSPLLPVTIRGEGPGRGMRGGAGLSILALRLMRLAALRRFQLALSTLSSRSIAIASSARPAGTNRWSW